MNELKLKETPTVTQHHQIDIDELFRQRDEYSRQAGLMRTALKETKKVLHGDLDQMLVGDLDKMIDAALKE